MNNYTIVIKMQRAGVTPAQVEAAVEDILLRALPPVTLQFGGAAQADAQTILVAVESDGKRDFLAHQLRGLENRLPVQVERIEWGNLIKAAPVNQAAPVDLAAKNGMEKQAAGPASGITADAFQSFPTWKALRSDPYADTEPQSEPVYRYRPSTWSNLRGALATLFLLIWIILFVVYLAMLGRSLPPFMESQAAMWIMQAWLLFSILLGPPYAPWQIITAVTCDAEGIEVQYFLTRARKRRAWAEIYGMNVNTLEMVLFSKQKPVRFSAKQRAGFSQEPVLIKTIITRANLRFASASLANYAYRRADAPG